jgi:hypothetical protein
MRGAAGGDPPAAPRMGLAKSANPQRGPLTHAAA